MREIFKTESIRKYLDRTGSVPTVTVTFCGGWSVVCLYGSFYERVDYGLFFRRRLGRAVMRAFAHAMGK